MKATTPDPSRGWVDLQPSDLDGQAVKIQPSCTVAEYLHGTIGKVIGRKWSVIEQRWNCVVVFDAPVHRHWSPSVPLDTIAVSRDVLQTI